MNGVESMELLGDETSAAYFVRMGTRTSCGCYGSILS